VFSRKCLRENIKSTTSLAKISKQSAQKLKSWCETLNVSQKELFTSCVAFAHHTCFLYCEIVLAYRLYCKKFLMFCFCFNIAKQPLQQIHAQDYNCNQSLSAFTQRNSFVSVFNKVESTTLCCLIFA